MYNPDWLRYCKRVVRAGAGIDHLLEPEVRVPTRYLGSPYGGWMIATTPLRDAASPVVLSFGLGDDVSFDEAMISTYRARVFGFDPTPASLRWLADHGIPASMRVEPIGIAAFDGEQAFAMPAGETRGNFSSKQRGDTTVVCQVRRYATILAMLGLRRVDVLKLDVEGAEYEVIDDLLASPILPDPATGGVPPPAAQHPCGGNPSVRSRHPKGRVLALCRLPGRPGTVVHPDLTSVDTEVLLRQIQPSAQMIRPDVMQEPASRPKAPLPPQAQARKLRRRGSNINPSSVSTEGIQAWQIKSL